MFAGHMADKLIAHIEIMLSLMNRNENKLTARVAISAFVN